MSKICRCGHHRYSHIMSKLVEKQSCLTIGCICRVYQERTIIDIQKDWVQIDTTKEMPTSVLDRPEGTGPGLLILPVGDGCEHHWGSWIPVRQKPWLRPRLFHATCRNCHTTKSFEPNPERGHDV